MREVKMMEVKREDVSEAFAASKVDSSGGTSEDGSKVKKRRRTWLLKTRSQQSAWSVNHRLSQHYIPQFGPGQLTSVHRYRGEKGCVFELIRKS